MIKLFSICIAVCLLSCEKPPAKLASDFSGWPIDMNGLISDMQASTEGQIEIREELEEKISPTVPKQIGTDNLNYNCRSELATSTKLANTI